MYKVYVVENDPIILDEIVSSIPWKDNGFEVIGWNTSPKVAISQIQNLKPHVIMSDLKMPIMDGVEMFENLERIGFTCKYIMLSAFANFEDSRRFFRIGGFDYLLKPLQHEEVQLVLEKIFLELSKSTRRNDLDIDNINPAFSDLVQYISQNFQSKHTLDSLGERFCLNPNYICSLFSKHYNTTLTRYLTQIRMNHALHMMQTTKKAYKEIAVDCGYLDYYYFCKVFKVFYGKSPSNYLKNKKDISYGS